MTQFASVPLRALGFSFAALAVAIAAAVFFGDSQEATGTLLWVLALTPAFLLAHYRDWRGITMALGVGMIIISLGSVVALSTNRELQDWPLFFVVSVYIAIALGGGWLSEVRGRIRELEMSELKLRQAYAELSRSHEELKTTQLQLIQAEKLDSVGRLAAGVAHEVKNPLMTILWGVRYLSEHILTDGVDDGNVAQLLEDIAAAVKRADTVIAGLLDYSALREVDLKQEDLNEIVDGSISLLKHEWNRLSITVVKELAADVPRLELDRFKLQQVLVNLLMNATHAMSDGGILNVRTFRRPAASSGGDPGRERLQRLMPQDDLVILQVEDSGPGIPEELLVKVFDPFFTTKPQGMGTGLGLSVVQQIIQMHRGSIEIENRKEGGARVTIAFKSQDEGDRDE